MEHFFDVKVGFLKHVGHLLLIWEDTKFKKIEKIVWWNKKIEHFGQIGWCHQNFVFGQTEKCKNLTKRAEHFLTSKHVFELFLTPKLELGTWQWNIVTMMLASNKNGARAKIVPQRQIEVANTKALVFTFLKEAKAASLKQNKANLVEVEVLQFSIFFFTFWSQKMLM